MALLVRLLWEAILLLAVVAVLGLLAMDENGRRMLTEQVSGLAVQVCVLGLLAAALSLSLRIGAANLAVGALASGGGVLLGRFTSSAGLSVPVAVLLVLAGAAVTGLVVGVVIAVLQIPSWAVTLTAALLISAVLRALNASDVIAVRGPDPRDWAIPLAVVLGLASLVVGALLWTHRGPALLGAAWGNGEPGPAGPRTAGGGLLLVAGIVLSSVLATAAGMVAVLNVRATTAPSAFGAEFLGSALAVVLIAGGSLRSPRGVVGGNVLAVVLVAFGQVLLTLHDVPFWAAGVLVGGLAAVGLLIGRGLDALAEQMTGRPPGTGPHGIARPVLGDG